MSALGTFLLLAFMATPVAWGQVDNVIHEIANLKDSESGIRANAVRTLGEMKDPRAVGPLVLALKDENQEVRTAAAYALGALKDARAVEPLISAQKDESEQVQGSAIVALGEFKNLRAVAALIVVLNDPNRGDDGGAASSLGRIGVLAIDPLIAKLKSSNQLVRMHAAEALGWIQGPRAFNALLVALKDPDAGVRAAAVEGLNGHRDAPGMVAAPYDLTGWLRSIEPWVQGATRDPRVIDLLIVALRDSDAQVRSTAVEKLKDLETPRAVGPLLALLHAPASGVGPKEAGVEARKNIVEALGWIGDARAVEPLNLALTDPDEHIREQAAVALGKIKNPDAVIPLIAALNDKSLIVRISAFSALGKIKDPRAVEPLIAALSNSNFQVSENAAVALGEIGDARAVSPLMAAFRSMRPMPGLPVALVRTNVVHALTEIGTPAVEPLTAASRDPDARVRLGAVTALGGIDDPGALVPLTAALGDSSVGIRAAAARGLAASKDSRAAQPVLAALKDKQKSVRESAVQALCLNPAPWVARPMIAALKDPDSGFEEHCVNSSTEALEGQITDPFLALLKDPDGRTRGLAAQVLSRQVAAHGTLRGSIDSTDTRVIGALLAALKAKDTAVISGMETFTFFVALGQPGSEDELIEALKQRGDKWIAGYLLTCGDAKLEIAARALLTERKMEIETHMIGPMWGSDRELLKSPSPPRPKNVPIHTHSNPLPVSLQPAFPQAKP